MAQHDHVVICVLMAREHEAGISHPKKTLLNTALVYCVGLGDCLHGTGGYETKQVVLSGIQLAGC